MIFETRAISPHTIIDSELSFDQVNGAEDQDGEDGGSSLEEPLFEDEDDNAEAEDSGAEWLDQQERTSDEESMEGGGGQGAEMPGVQVTRP